MPGKITSFNTDPGMTDLVQVRKTSPNTVVWEFRDIWDTLNEIRRQEEGAVPEIWEDLTFALSASSKIPTSTSDILLKIVLPVVGAIIALAGLVVALSKKK
jgi:hypothetical protein